MKKNLHHGVSQIKVRVSFTPRPFCFKNEHMEPTKLKCEWAQRQPGPDRDVHIHLKTLSVSQNSQSRIVMCVMDNGLECM